jgi:hypothetical protein
MSAISNPVSWAPCVEMSERQQLNPDEKIIYRKNIMQSQENFTCKKLQAGADIDPLISHEYQKEHQSC